MPVPRVYVDLPLAPGAALDLPEPASRHVAQVLRLGVGCELRLFNGDGRDYEARVARATRQGAHVEDLVQETFVVAHRRRADLAGIENLRGWLYRVAANQVRHHHRGAQRRARLAAAYLAEAQATSQDPDEAAQRRANALLVRSCVAELSDKLREVLVLYEFEDLAGREIAALLEIPEKTVWSRLRLARKQFEQLVRDRSQRVGRRR